jgi:hypothetical protein
VNPLTRYARLVIFSTALFLTVGVFGADRSLAHVRNAQAILGPDVWSQVIRIENKQPSARHRRVVHALVFELAQILWFYAPTEGTQSFSLHKDRLAEEKADFAPLLRAIDPGFTRWSVVADSASTKENDGTVPNGCFIRSVVALRDRVLAGGEADRPHLLSYYIGTSTGQQGHTVLAYETAGRVEVVDATQGGRRYHLPAALAKDALKLARAMEGNRVAAARLLPLSPLVSPGLYTNAEVVLGGDVANSG